MTIKSMPLPRTLRLQPSEFTDYITGDGHELTKLPYPFYVFQTGRVGLQGFWHGRVKRAIGFQADLAKHVIDLHWQDAWSDPEKTVGMYLVTADASGTWSVHPTAIASATMSEQSALTMTREEVVTAKLDIDDGVWRSGKEIHEMIADDGWPWTRSVTKAVLDRLVRDGVAESRQPGGARSLWQFRAVSNG
jgi:hypothetical protein